MESWFAPNMPNDVGVELHVQEASVDGLEVALMAIVAASDPATTVIFLTGWYDIYSVGAWDAWYGLEAQPNAVSRALAAGFAMITGLEKPVVTHAVSDPPLAEWLKEPRLITGIGANSFEMGRLGGQQMCRDAEKARVQHIYACATSNADYPYYGSWCRGFQRGVEASCPGAGHTYFGDIEWYAPGKRREAPPLPEAARAMQLVPPQELVTRGNPAGSTSPKGCSMQWMRNLG